MLEFFRFEKIKNLDKDQKQHAKLASMQFSTIYECYLNKVVKKGRKVEELNQVINWLTGYNENKLNQCIDKKITFEDFFNNAKINPNSKLIKGTICGVKIEEIENLFVKNVRYLDKLVDELARNKSLEKIFRK